MNYENTQKLLAEYGQEHLLEYYNELDSHEQENLLAQIEKIDFSLLESLNKDVNSTAESGTIEPIKAVTSADIAEHGEEYFKA
ncbi:MAG: UDPGP type 1 family protein, partial [Ruminococcus sp.]|nr:UDPGP type 1 family protein [Ruminococcus sp.]